MSAAMTLVEERQTFPVEMFTIKEDVGQHDLVTVTLANRPTVDLLSGTPVQVQQLGMEEFDFSGYLDTAVPYNNGDGSRGGVYFLLSASTVMRSGTTRTWDNRTPFEIAKDIVEPHGLGLEMDRYVGKVSHFAQTTESDWEALRNLASDIGYVLSADNAVVRLADPPVVIRRAESQPLQSLTITAGSKFVMEESLTPVGYESYEFVGIDKFGVSFSVKANEESLVRKLIREEVESLGDALAAASRVKSRQAAQNRATLVTDYHPSIHVGSVVLVDEGDRSRHWFVLTATHTFNEKPGATSSTTLTLCRSTGFTSGSIPRNVRHPATVLSNSKWRAAYSWAAEL